MSRPVSAPGHLLRGPRLPQGAHSCDCACPVTSPVPSRRGQKWLRSAAPPLRPVCSVPTRMLRVHCGARVPGAKPGMKQILTDRLLTGRRSGGQRKGGQAGSRPCLPLSSTASGKWSPIFTHKPDASIAAALLGSKQARTPDSVRWPKRAARLPPQPRFFSLGHDRSR